MSGICGILSRTPEHDIRSHLDVMLRAGKHRGPDGVGQHVDGEAGLGHLLFRLRSPSLETAQPLSNHDRSLWIVFDGTLFERDALIAALAAAGRTMPQVGDAALFLAAFEAWGPGCLDRIDGVFAAAVWDVRRRTLLCARDRIGVKPLFYAHWAGRFLFASEIQQILAIPGFPRRPNDRMVGDYLGGDIDLYQDTFFDGIRRLPAGVYAWIQNGVMQQTTYWDVDPSRQIRLPSDDAYGDRFRELLMRAVRKNMAVDVPVGSNLSGGLDSSSIVCLASRIKQSDGDQTPLETFSVTFEDKACDERPFIHVVGQQAHITHNPYVVDGAEVFKQLRAVQERQAEPFRSVGVGFFWKLKEVASRKGMRVLLNGMGADEVLGGINLYYLADLVRSGRWAALRRALERSSALDPFALGLSPWQLLLKFGIRPLMPPAVDRLRKRVRGHSLPDFIDATFAKRIGLTERLTTPRPRRFPDRYRQMSYEGFRHQYTPLLLHYEDTNGAGHGVESRFPFLDREIVEYLFALPAEQKIRDGVAKVVLRNGMRGILPDAVRTRTDKGFIDKQVDDWLRREYSQDVMGVLNGRSLRQSGYVDIPRAQQLYRAYQSGQPGRITVWKIFNLGLWLETFLA